MLRLCADCERHVRASEMVCPYCGGADSKKVPAAVRGNRNALYVGVGVLVFAASDAACTQAVYGAPVEPCDCPQIDALDSGAPEGRQPVRVPEKCERNYPAQTPSTGGLGGGRGSCTQDEIGRLREACFGTGTSCLTETKAHSRCSSCLFGTDTPLESSTLGAWLVTPQQQGPNRAACRAMAAGRPDCVVSVTLSSFCLEAVCGGCLESRASCESAARQRACGGLVSASCEEAAQARADDPCGPPGLAVPLGLDGRSARDLENVAMRLCGPLPSASDAGTDARPADASGD